MSKENVKVTNLEEDIKYALKEKFDEAASLLEIKESDNTVMLLFIMLECIDTQKPDKKYQALC